MHSSVQYKWRLISTIHLNFDPHSQPQIKETPITQHPIPKTIDSPVAAMHEKLAADSAPG